MGRNQDDETAQSPTQEMIASLLLIGFSARTDAAPLFASASAG
jgi:hypothetical protein